MQWLQKIRRAIGLGGMSRSDIAMMSCEDVTSRLYDFVDSELDEATRETIKAHLDAGACECRRALLMEIAFNERVRGSLECGGAPKPLKDRILQSLTE